ncbi:ABC transporter substrate-binding protein [Dehalococcoidia bacterium]|nr:ABC transporter substrate-binding protein [Dehalococcoidia bacterium]
MKKTAPNTLTESKFEKKKEGLMNKIVPILVAVTLLASLFAIGCPPPRVEEVVPETITIVDSAGRVVEIPQPLERIAVLDAGPAKIIRALGATDRIVGINSIMATRRAHFWPELQDRPNLGTWRTRNYEEIIALEPQVLITLSRGVDIKEKLEPAGIIVVTIDAHILETLTRDIKTLGLILGKETEAEEFANFLQSKIDLIEERVAEIPPEERKTVYMEGGGRDFFTWGPGSAGDKVLRKAGGINIFADIGMSSAHIDPEEILVRDPDVIVKCPWAARIGGFLATCPSDMAAKKAEMIARPGWSELSAVKDGRVYIFGQGLMGPKRVINLWYLAYLLYPDIFADLDVEAFHREFVERFQGLEFQGIWVYPAPGTN